MGTGTSVRPVIRTAGDSRTKAIMGFSRKSTSPTSTLEASAPGGIFFMKFMSTWNQWKTEKKDQIYRRVLILNRKQKERGGNCKQESQTSLLGHTCKQRWRSKVYERDGSRSFGCYDNHWKLHKLQGTEQRMSVTVKHFIMYLNTYFL